MLRNEQDCRSTTTENWGMAFGVIIVLKPAWWYNICKPFGRRSFKDDLQSNNNIGYYDKDSQA